MDLAQLGELVTIALVSALAVISSTARPRFRGMFRPRLGHASRADLVKSLNETLLICVFATVASCLVYGVGGPEWALPALCFVAGMLAAYIVAMLRLR